MFALGPALAARTRARASIPTLATLFPGPAYSTAHGKDSKPNRDKRRTPPATLIDNAPGWREDLATVSEASVKADRETTTIDKMQQKTVDYVHAHRHDPEVEQTRAAYAREEIDGPLGNAGVGEFEGVVGNDDLGPDDTQVESDGRVVTRRTVMHEKKVFREGKANV